MESFGVSSDQILHYVVVRLSNTAIVDTVEISVLTQRHTAILPRASAEQALTSG
jgi:hypothetical protein